ncbi:caspase, EACC1-associated type [Nocardia sp. CA-107356]|uniref:caspase, EACC1-associated type n=1 Tax=Nocardia sp. CA-107356 TaxID=3239972 RepID=UPI003D908B84
MTDLSGEGVRILVLATATHTTTALPPLPTVAQTFSDLHAAFIERCGAMTENVVGVLDPPDARTMAAAIAEEAARARSVLVVYFLGHGLRGPGGELYLAAKDTGELIPGLAAHQALSFAALAQALGECRAPSVVVILDCCFSGSATLEADTASIREFATGAHGRYLIGSAEHLASAPAGQRHTAFSGALLQLLENGDPRAPSMLTLDALFDGVYRSLRDAQRGPLPRRQAGDRAGTLIIAANPAAAPTDEPARDPTPGRSPYPGLASFGPDDAGMFFGRATMLARLLDELAVAATEGGPRVLVGASGSGKTSLLNAGVIAALRDRGLPGVAGSVGWALRRFTPGADPLQRLVAALDAPDSRDLIDRDPGRVTELADKVLARRPGDTLTVIVDQLEELFTLCADTSTRTAFLRALTALAEAADGSTPCALVVMALRADFYGHAVCHPELVAALRDRQILIEPMTRDELREAIDEPALRNGWCLADGLADIVINDLGPGASAEALPLLSHAMLSTWHRRDGNELTVAGYRDTGGIAHAIKQSADSIYASADDAGRDALRTMLPRLVRVGADGDADTGRPCDRTDLTHAVPDLDVAHAVLDRLTESRLITMDRDTVRLAHEALLREWPRLRAWIDSDRARLRAEQQLAHDAGEWEHAERDSSLLYRGTRLAALREQLGAADVTTELEPVSAGFVEASARQERRSTRIRQTTVAVLAVLALLATVGLTGALLYQQKAADAQQRDLARYLAAEAENLRSRQPGLAKQLSVLAYRIDAEAGLGSLLNSRNTPGMINQGRTAADIATSADGNVLAISSVDAIAVRRTQGSEAGLITDLLAGAIAVNPAGTLLAAATFTPPGSVETDLRLWDTTDVTHPIEVVGMRLESAVTAMAIAPDGATLYAGTSTGEILRWNITQPATPSALPILRARSAQIDTLTVAPHRGLFASATIDGHTDVWDVSNPVPVTTLDIGAEPYAPRFPVFRPWHRIAFDPEGRYLAAPHQSVIGSGDQRPLLLWDLGDPTAPRTNDSPPVTNSTGQCYRDITSIAFDRTSRDIGEFVAVCGETWQLWRYSVQTGAIAAGASVSAETGHASGHMLFDPRHAGRAFQATDQGVAVWGISNPAQPGAAYFLPGPPRLAAPLVFRSKGSGEVLIVGTSYGNFVWTSRGSVKDGADNPTYLSAAPAFLGQDIGISPDGSYFAAVEENTADDYVLRFRSTSDPASGIVATIDDLVNGVAAVAFSPTQPILAVADDQYDAPAESRVVRLYDVSDPHHPRPIVTIPAPANWLAFTADGTTLLTAESASSSQPQELRPTIDMRLRAWSVVSRTSPSELWSQYLPASERGYSKMALSPDSALLALYGSDGLLRLWKLKNNSLEGSPVVVPVGAPRANITFSHDGKRLALAANRVSSSGEYLVRPEIWNVANPDAPFLESYLSQGDVEKLAFSPDGTALAVARSGSGVEIWNLDPEPIVGDVCNAVGDPMTRQEWMRYLPDRDYRPPCA